MTDDAIVIPPPPRLPNRDAGTSVLASALPILGSVMSVALVAGLGGSGSRAMLGAGAFLVSSLAFLGLQADRQRRQRQRVIGESREDYLEHLSGLRRQVHLAAAAQRAAASTAHPPVSALAARVLAGTAPRVAGEPPYLRLRSGPRPAPLSPPLLVPDGSLLRKADPALSDAVRRFAATHATVADQPHVIDLRTTRRIGLGGDLEQARAMVCEAIACHHPAELEVVVAASAESTAEWAWLDWLPRLGPAQHTLVVHAGGSLPTPTAATTVLDLEAPVDPGVGGARCDRATAEALARVLARRRATTPSPAAEALDLLADKPGHLAVRFGHDESGAPVVLDLTEAALGGVGPHGLLVGATGSGKSELLRTIVLGLGLTHTTDELNLVLVDFKGGATFAGLARLPHVTALVTNLAEDLALVDRLADALTGELERRQQLLHDAGFSCREDLEAARRADATLEPLPSLFIVVDEFSELLAARPEFVDVFVGIGRLGRSLGLHLLLASQRLEEGRLRGLESHLSYRLGLRTFSAAESRAVLGTTDAHDLPSRPGIGLLRAGSDGLVRFRAAYASDRLDDAVDHIEGTPARPIWLPPLEAPPSLDEFQQEPDLLRVGLVDLPRAQRHAPLAVDFSGAGVHLAVVGGPRSGKSSLLAAVVTALALGRSPLERQFHLLDLGGALTGLTALPHVASAANHGQTDLVGRVVRHVHALLEERERGERGPEVFLVVDGWATLTSEYDDLPRLLQAIATRGLAHGMHLIATAHRWSDFRGPLRDLFGSRLELRLGDPYESEVDRRLAARVPEGRPGRGLTRERHHFLAAVATHESIRSAQERWPGPAVRRLVDLPADVDLDSVPTAGDAIRLGVDDRIDPVCFDGDHLLVTGAPGTGRTTTLRTLCREIVRTRSTPAAQVIAVDARRSLIGEVHPAHLIEHASGPAAADLLRTAATHLSTRLPGPHVSAAGLRQRSWWTGAELWVVVDDLDLVPGPSPLAPLAPLLPHAHEVGLHLVVAQREPARIHDPVVAAMVDLGATRLHLGQPAGRATCSRHGSIGPTIQVAWTSPAG